MRKYNLLPHNFLRSDNLHILTRTKIFSNTPLLLERDINNWIEEMEASYHNTGVAVRIRDIINLGTLVVSQANEFIRVMLVYEIDNFPNIGKNLEHHTNTT